MRGTISLRYGELDISRMPARRQQRTVQTFALLMSTMHAAHQYADDLLHVSLARAENRRLFAYSAPQ